MATRSPAFKPSDCNAKNNSSTRKRNSSVDTSIHCPFLLNLNAPGLPCWSTDWRSKLGIVETAVDARYSPSLNRIPASSFNILTCTVLLDEGERVSPNKRTPLFAVHKALNARLIPFGGWEMPVEYSGISKEHTAVRTAAGLFDVSHMGEFEIRGPEALDLIQHVTTNDASKLRDGQAQYSAMAYPHGTVVDDLLVYRYTAEHFLVVVNAANVGKDFEWINSHNRSDASVEDITYETTLLAIQGPRALEILQPLTQIDLSKLANYRFVQG